jgi:hypothetical protein
MDVVIPTTCRCFKKKMTIYFSYVHNLFKFFLFILKNQNYSSLRINTMLSMRFTLVGSFIIDNHDRYLVANSNTLQYSRFLRLWFGILVFG